MARWNGDEYRWHRWSAPGFACPTISVIEAAPDVEAERNAKPGPRVPFGFARVLSPVEHEPQLWEGDDG